VNLEGFTRAGRNRIRLAMGRKQAAFNQKRRDANRAVGWCINETSPPTHGPAAKGVRCSRCAAVHKHGAAAVRAMEVEW